MTPKQQRFIEEYLIDSNATAAAKRAGYSTHTANEQGARLLANVSVAAAIQAGHAEHRERTNVTVDGLTKDLRAAYDMAKKKRPVGGNDPGCFGNR